ncbi:MAG: hypothetical protein DSZ23_02920 [Thermodesulfatator sp.]|nr:MAG: hypothetical protein DSZ23_02920 [Thermodesulfatator sp.]
MEYYCEKDNRQTDISKGCRHPNDFCQHRQACMIHFLEQEEKKNRDLDSVQALKKGAEDKNHDQRM